MSRPTITPKPTNRKPAIPEHLERESVMIAPSKARAAHDLLAAVAHADDLIGDALKVIRSEQTDAQRDERLEWIESFADDALKAALDEAEEAYVKCRTEKEAAA